MVMSSLSTTPTNEGWELDDPAGRRRKMPTMSQAVVDEEEGKV